MANDAGEALERLREDLGPKRAGFWLRGAESTREDGAITLIVPYAFQKRALETQFPDGVAAALGRDARIRVASSGSTLVTARPRKGGRTLAAGPGNELAMKLVRSFVQGGPGASSLLVVRGDAGSGKSLLADWAISLAGGRTFTLDLERLRRGGSRHLTPRKPLLVVDGVEKLAGAPGAQRVLCRILDEVRDRGDRVLVTLRGHPRNCEGLNGALCSRLLGGVVAELDAPGARKARVAAEGAGLPERSQATLASLMRAASGAFGVDAGQLRSLTRRRGIVEARRAVMAAAVREGVPAAVVAEALGLKSDRSVREGCRWAERQEHRDPRFAALMYELLRDNRPR